MIFINCVNCGHPLASSKCEYCGTTYPDFKEPEPEEIQYCGGAPVFYTDHDILDLQYKLIVKCKKCGYRTKTYKIPNEEMYEAGTYDFITMSPTVQEALDEFNKHI